MGKTNLLDAIYYLCIGKSYFSGSDKLVARLDKGFFRIDGQIDEERIVAKVQPTKDKTIEIQGVKIDKLSDFVGRYPIVVIAPGDVPALIDESDNRRMFINYSIAQYHPGYLSDLLHYNRLLKHRNSMLKNHQETHHIDQYLLDTIDEQLVPLAERIFDSRTKFIEILTPAFIEAFQKINEKTENLGLMYESCMQQGDFADLLRQNIQRDLFLGRTSKGIHKDDLIFSINGHKLKDFGSQGQIKTFILALKIAQYSLLKKATLKNPFLILDDIFDKLDTKRINHLLQMIAEGSFGQIFISDANKTRINTLLQENNITYESHWVENGKLSKL